MSTHSSGYYSIDEHYNIIGFNDAAKEIYPSLVLGQKCYQALMGLDSPCPPCPVANGIYGPKTYLDPIRHIYETVDAVKTVFADGSRGHALVFSTVAEGERLSNSIPTDENSLRLLGAVNLLSSKYATVFGVNLSSQRLSVYRSENLFGSRDILLRDNMSYGEMLDLLSDSFVHPEERASIRAVMNLDAICGQLAKVPSFKIHCRVPGAQMHYYYLIIARNGEAESFEDIVVAIACEDDDVNARRIYARQLEALLSSLTHCPGYFHLDITADRILKTGGYSSFLNVLDPDCSIDLLTRGMASYIPTEEDRRDFLETYSAEAMKRAFDAGQVQIVRESRCRYDDNIVRWSRYTMRLFMNPGNNHLEGVLFGEDITKERQAYETQVSIIQTLSSNYQDVLLLSTRERTAAIIKHAGFLSGALDNGAYYPYDELLEKNIFEKVHPEDREMMRRATGLDHVLEELADKNEYQGNFRILRDGEVHHCQFRFINNQDFGIVVLGLLNVDNIVSAEIRQQKLLQKALEDAKRANLEKSRFLARMSHDMRTPLNGIRGVLEIDKKHADDVEYLKENRKKAELLINHLVSLINDVLDMAKIEEGNLVLADEPFNLFEEGREAAVLIHLQAREKGLKVVLTGDIPDQELGYVYGSPLHLRRALMNIYSNCIKYNRENGSIATNIQMLDQDEDHVTVRWTISDTGIGMSPEFLKQIFEPFSQENMDARSVYQGTGLGMSIAKAIVEKMGGTLEITSEQNVGSTFVVTIPFRRARRQDVIQTEDGEPDSIRGMRLLLAEDNDLNREIAETILQEEGASVTAVADGKAAVEAVLQAPESFDLVLMDIMMPVMDGLEAARCLRSKGVTIPVVAMTANAFAEDVQASIDAGMNAHLAKPLDLEKLMHTIAQYRPKKTEE